MTELSRGAVVLFAEKGDYTAKPRPGVVVQHHATLADSPSITLCGISTVAVPGASTRIGIDPDPTNGLRDLSFVMVDKVSTIRRSRIRSVVGRLDGSQMAQVDIALRRWLDL